MSEFNFSNLLPEIIFTAIEEQGFRPTGALFPLNSYENRVYEIGLENHAPLIAKFYRPQRWSMEALSDEHNFMSTLAENDIPIVSPYPLPKPMEGCESLAEVNGIYYCLYDKFPGREHADLNLEDRQWLGRTLARLHNVGETFDAPHRLFLDPNSFGYDNIEIILNLSIVPDDLKSHLETTLEQTLNLVDPFFEQELTYIPLHGDCHLGNILWNDQGLHLVDFDDMIKAPPVQDVWMLFHGSEREQNQQKEAFFEGYETFRAFDHDTLVLMEPLRVLRMIRHNAWIGQRYSEGIFQRTFTYFSQRKHWEELLLSLKEQISILQELYNE